jgi:membrane protein
VVSKVPAEQNLKARIAALTTWIQSLKPVRVFTHYGAHRGALLAAGLSYQAIFAVFAALWVAFSVIGLFLRSSPELQTSLFALLGRSVPGLIDSGNGAGGAIKASTLLQAGILGWTGAIALVGLLSTALGWLASGRTAVRGIFDLTSLSGNVLLLKLKDLGLAICFGAALLVSAALSVFSTAALGFFLSLIGADPKSLVAVILGTVIGLLLTLALDTFVLASFFRIVAGIQIPRRRLLGGALIGGIALGILKALGSSLLGGASHNPLLASFAVIIGLLIWFNLICQVILLSAAWIAVGMIDAGIPFDPKAEAAKLEEVARLGREAREQARVDAARRPSGLVARLVRPLRTLVRPRRARRTRPPR